MTRNEKLNHLIKILKDVTSDERFNMGIWWREDPGINCGFAACALGWAAMDPAFQDMGLTCHTIGETDLCYKVFISIRFERGKMFYHDFNAAREFFDISREETAFIFNPFWYLGDHIPDDKLLPLKEYCCEKNIDLGNFMLTENSVTTEMMMLKRITPSLVISHVELVRDFNLHYVL